MTDNVVGLKNEKATPHTLVNILTNQLNDIESIVCCVKMKSGAWVPICSGTFSDISFAAHLIQHRLFQEWNTP